MIKSFALLIPLALGSSALLANSPTSPTSGESMSSTTQALSKKLVVIGASYAAEWGQPNLPGYAVVNKGVGGEESSDVRARFEEDVVALQPDTVLIWGHYNDVVRAPVEAIEQAKEKARGNYRAMVERARAAGIRPMLATEITMPIPDTWTETLMRWIGGLLGKEDYRSRINSHVKDVNQWLRDYARTEQLVLLDFERELDSGNGTRKVEYAREDGSHVSPAGYEAISRYAHRELSKVH